MNDRRPRQSRFLRHALFVPVILGVAVFALQFGRGYAAPAGNTGGDRGTAAVVIDARGLPFGGDHPATQLLRRHPAGDADLEAGKAAAVASGPSVAAPGATAPSPLVAGPASATTAGFDGISSAESSCGGCIPPDGAIAVGPNHIIGAVNTAFKIWDKNGGVFAGYPKSLASLLLVNPACLGNISDPFAEYDAAANRFMLGALTYDASSNSSICIAVSQTGDPSATWYVYGFTVTPAQVLMDFPHATIGAAGIYVTANQFQNGTTFTGARIYAYDMAQMYAGQGARSAFVDVGNNSAGKQADTLMPARGMGASATQYFIAADNSACPCSNISVWRWTDPFGASTFSVAGGVTVNSYDQPPNAPQLGGSGSSGLIAVNDTADLAAYWSNGTLYGAHTVSTNPGGGTVAGVQWYQIGNLTTAPSLLQQGTIAANGQYRYYPNLSVDSTGNMMIAYGASSSAEYAGIRYAAHLAGDVAGTLQPEVMLRAGGATVSPSNRYGDYAGAAVDPDGCALWHFEEYARAGSIWGTWAGSVRFSGCVVATPSPTSTRTPTNTPTNTPTPTPTPTAPPPPAILHASSSGTSTTIQGTLLAAPATAYNVTIDFAATCDRTGATVTVLGSLSVTTDGSGRATFTQLFNQFVPAGTMIMGTAAAAGGPVSPLSPCTAVVSRQCPDDTLCNGYTDAQKIALGKDPFTYCYIMRADVDGDGVVAILDFVRVAQYYTQHVPPAPARYDQDADKVISILDLTKMARVFTLHVTACP